jgi:nitrite reductase/ring-hydroxylating ferredoxin subunit
MLPGVQDEEVIRRTGPGTLMGDLFRRYWHPVLLSADLPQPDGPPVAVKVLSESLVAFRDSEGQVGLLDEACPHRGYPLSRGINGNRRLTCIFHRWAFDVTGRCVDDLPDAGQIRARAYPTVESAGMIWAYLGPADAPPPPPPRFGFSSLPPEQLVVTRSPVRATYLRCAGEHLLAAYPAAGHATAPLAIEDTAHGLRLSVGGGGGEGGSVPAFAVWHVLPAYTFVPWPGAGGGVLVCVPVDEWSSMRFVVAYSPQRPFTLAERDSIRSQGIPLEPGSTPPESGGAVERLRQRLINQARALREGVAPPAIPWEEPLFGPAGDRWLGVSQPGAAGDGGSV